MKHLIQSNASYACGVLLFLTSCGPMNNAPKQDVGNNPPAKLIGNTNISKNSQFYVSALLIGVPGTAAPKVAQLGDNSYRVRFVHSEDLQPPATNAKVTFVYWMPDMPDMGTTTEPGVRGDDGSYTAKLFFGMAGKWQVTVTMEDGSVKDQHVFETQL